MKKIDINEIKGYGKFAVILKCLLAKNHVTQVELADAIGLSGATITNYVKGRSTPTQQNLEKIAKFLKVTPQTFYSDTNDFVPYINQYEKTFAEKLSQLLKEREISQEELSAKLGLSRQTINYYVNGKTMPMPDILSSICDFFNVPMNYFIAEEETIKNESDMRIIVNKRPTTKKECLFIKHDFENEYNECKFGGLCDLKNCKYLQTLYETNEFEF